MLPNQNRERLGASGDQYKSCIHRFEPHVADQSGRHLLRVRVVAAAARRRLRIAQAGAARRPDLFHWHHTFAVDWVADD
jgi:hypothetical protein